jgi:chaperonin GroEL
LSSKLEALKAELKDEEKVGVDIIMRSMEAPLKQIADNAGAQGAVVVEKVRAMEFNFGYNAMTDTYEDLIAAGIIDPAKVVRSALQDAASIASMVLTTEALVVEKPEKGGGGPPDMGRMGGMGGMGGMM